MRHRIVGCVLAALVGTGLLWPATAEAQRPRPPHTPATGRAVPAPRPIHGGYPVYSHRYYYGGYYPSTWNWGLYWGWGYPWYPYYGWGYPWYGYGWGYPYYGPGPYPYYYDNSASVRVQASPREAQVYVDGYYVGVVDDFDGTFQRLKVSPGGHEITLHLNGYRNASERMYLQPNSTYRLRTQLEPLPAGAPQDPVPAPSPDATRWREHDRRGMEPGPEQPEPAGPPSTRWPPRQQAQEQQAAQGFGTLRLRVEPPDAEVSVDGTPWRGTPDEDGILAIQVARGTHRIEIRREGFVSYVADVNVRANAATALNVMLQREQ